MAKGSGKKLTYGEATEIARQKVEAAGFDLDSDKSMLNEETGEEDPEATDEDSTAESDESEDTETKSPSKAGKPADVDGTPTDEDESEEQPDDDESSESQDQDSQDEEESEEDEPPLEYMGRDLSDIPAERRKEIIAAFEQTDEYTRSVERRAAEAERKLAEEGGQQQPETDDSGDSGAEPLNVDAILDNLYGPLSEDNEDDLASLKREAVKPVLENLLPVVQQQQQFIDSFAARQMILDFGAEVERLVDQHKTEVDPEALWDYMDEHDIDDIEAAFLKMTNPARSKLDSIVTDERRKQSEEARRKAKKGISGTRGRNASRTEAKAPPKNLSPMEAGERALKKLGLS